MWIYEKYDIVIIIFYISKRNKISEKLDRR